MNQTGQTLAHISEGSGRRHRDARPQLSETYDLAPSTRTPLAFDEAPLAKSFAHSSLCEIKCICNQIPLPELHLWLGGDLFLDCRRRHAAIHIRHPCTILGIVGLPGRLYRWQARYSHEHRRRQRGHHGFAGSGEEIPRSCHRQEAGEGGRSCGGGFVAGPIRPRCVPGQGPRGGRRLHRRNAEDRACERAGPVD